MTEIDKINANAQKAIASAVDTTGDAVRVAVERLADIASQASGKLELTGGQLQDAQLRATQSCRDYVREKPLTSIGIAVASGFLLSCALRQR